VSDPSTADPLAEPALPYVYDVEVVGLVVAPLQRYVGRPGVDPVAMPDEDRRTEVRVLAGRGIEGDRYCGKAAHRRAQVTVLSAESLDHVASVLGSGPEAPALDPLLARRNVVVRGVQVDGVLGHDLSLDCGDGPVRLGSRSPARPCRWMDDVFGAGAQRALRGRGGVRCEALGDGVLRLGPARLASAVLL
jgi:MOSC domain-containing protein YiiM